MEVHGEETDVARAVWSGSISFGLVNVPVKLHTAVRSHNISFRQINRRTNNRVRYRKVDAETGDEVDREDIVKGWEVDDGRYVLVEPDELEALDPEASRTIDILDFVDLTQIDPIYYDRPYYLAPDGDAAVKPYRLLVAAMAETGKVAIARFVMRSNEHLAAIRASEELLVLETMQYADEVVDPSGLAPPVEEVDLDAREIELAEQLIKQLVTEFDPDRYEDQHQERVREFLHEKAEGREPVVEAAAEPSGGVIDLMEALEQSLGQRSARDYSSMTKSELYEIARDRDLPGRSDMTKDELVTALQEADERAA